MIKQKLFLFILPLAFQTAFSQIPEDCGECNNCEQDCGPYQYAKYRENITGKKVETEPFNGIIHIGVKRLARRPLYSTASFIADDILITANHNVMVSGAITSIEFCLKTPTKDNWVKVSSKYLEVIHLHSPHDKWQDIALIKLKNPSFLKNFKRTIFEFNDIDRLGLDSSSIIHLTGFPCDKADTLVEKNTMRHQIHIDATQTIIAYPTLFTCVGDSGAPLWVNKNGKYYIVGIHHGGDDIGAFPNIKETSIAIRISSQILRWLNQNSKR